MTSTKPEASTSEKLAFLATASLSGTVLLRNLLRMRRDCRSFRDMLQLTNADFAGILNILEGKQQKGLVLLQSVTPNFPLNYFQNIEDPKQYQARLGKFYQGLQFEEGFEGTLKHRGRDYHIEFRMDRPTVGADLAGTTREFDRRNMKLYKYQMISVFGELSYNRERKRGVMETRMLCLDWPEF